jgi:type I restriction enzyme S subunit
MTGGRGSLENLFNNVVNNLYLANYLHYLKAIGFFEQKRQQSTINSTFNASIAAGTPILFPERDEQIRIVDVLSACDNKIAALEKEITTLNELFQALLEELMNGRLAVGNLLS